MEKIIILNGCNPGQVFELEKDEMIVGRSSANDIQIIDRCISVSYTHLRAHET